MNTTLLDIKKIEKICRQNDVSLIGIFGSFARGEEQEQSDIDILVRFSKRKGILTLVKVEREFSEALGKKVDLLTEASLSPYIKDKVMDDLKVIYDVSQ